MTEAFGDPAERCVPCASATSGLSAALIAADVSGQVLIPAFTFPATLGAVLAAGLVPSVIDVDEDSWAIGADALDTALSASDAKAVILVAPFGMQCDFAAHRAVCRRHDAIVVIDNAAGLGVKRLNICDEESVFEIFSLHATKPMGIGEGGLIFCHKNVERKLRSVLNFGLGTYADPRGPNWGFNGKLSELHAAIGLAQLQRRDWIVQGRQRFAGAYIALLAQYPELSSPTAMQLAPWQIFPLAMPDRRSADAAEMAAADLGIEFRRYYRPSLSQWPNIQTIGTCPVSESLASRMLALPVRSVGRVEQASEIVALVKEAITSAMQEAECP